MKIKILTVLASLIAMSSISIYAQTFQKPDPAVWYRLSTRYNGTDQRRGRCIEYYPEGSVHSGMLWSADPVAESSPEYDYQLWRFVPSPDNPDRYKMVCKADPDGFVNPAPTASDASARWLYVASAAGSSVDPYGFIFVLDDDMSGVDSNGLSYCALATDATINNYYSVMNCGAARQDYAINLWSDDYSEDANEWLFRFEKKSSVVTAIEDISADDDTDSSVYYDLYGRRVADPAGGIVICRGKKVMIK